MPPPTPLSAEQRVNALFPPPWVMIRVPDVASSAQIAPPLPEVAEQSVNEHAVMVATPVPEKDRLRAPPFGAEQLVNEHELTI